MYTPAVNHFSKNAKPAIWARALKLIFMTGPMRKLAVSFVIINFDNVVFAELGFSHCSLVNYDFMMDILC